MLTGDWTTYIVAPNALRGAPLFSMPIGSVPGYIAPTGSSLGLSDATPVLLPVYRILNVLSPDRPTQLLGWIVLASYVLTYYWSTKFIRRAALQLGGRPGLATEVGARIASVGLLVMPFFSARIVHISLSQQWLLVMGLYWAVFHTTASRRNDAVVAGMAITAAVIHPYLLPQVLVIALPYIVRRTKASLARGISLVAVIVIGSIASIYALGYGGGGASTTNGGYGMFNADVLFLVSVRGTSWLLPSLPWTPPAFDGLGFVGTGIALLMLGAVCVSLHRRRWLPSRAWRGLLAALVALAIFATWPTIRVAGREFVDFTDTPLSLRLVGDVFRSNERFVWPLCWLLALWGCSVMVSAIDRRRLVAGAVAFAVIVQLADTPRFPFIDRGDRDYSNAVAVLTRQQDTGAVRVDVEPPYIPYSCVTGSVIPADDLAPVLLAAAVRRIPISSGYPARPVDDMRRDICEGLAVEFAAGRHAADALYVLNESDPNVADMVCEPLVGVLVACRASA